MKYSSFLITAILFISIACSQVNPPSIKIGSQTWTQKNLDVTTFRNGDPIPEAKTNAEWVKAGEQRKPAWCYYNNDPANGTKYGKLYNWFAVSDPRGLAPKGWHVSSDAEWTILTDFLGGENGAGTQMKSSNGWKDNRNGTNESGFTGLPGGGRWRDGTFANVGDDGKWWSSSEEDPEDDALFPGAWYRYLYNTSIFRRVNDKKDGFSVRCLRD